MSIIGPFDKGNEKRDVVSNSDGPGNSTRDHESKTVEIQKSSSNSVSRKTGNSLLKHSPTDVSQHFSKSSVSETIVNGTQLQPSGKAVTQLDDDTSGSSVSPEEELPLTKPWKGIHNRGLDNENHDLILKTNEFLVNSESRTKYKILGLLGFGTFGQVARCVDCNTEMVWAIKVIKNQPAYYHQAQAEIGILNLLNQKYDSNDRNHIVRMQGHFVHHQHLCIVFELLKINLFELIKTNRYLGLPMEMVRSVTKQILEALIVLQEANVIHCDLKPENVLIKSVDSQKNLDVKLIDFGSACLENRTIYTYIQSRFYRSPEVLLGHAYTKSIDLWSLGCLTVELFLGLPLFPGASEYDLVQRMVETLGCLPPDEILRKSKNAQRFFEKVPEDRRRSSEDSVYSLLTPEQFEQRSGKAPSFGKRYFKDKLLDDIIFNYSIKRTSKPSHSPEEITLRSAFVHFVRGMIDFDPRKRWTAWQACQHPYIKNQDFKEEPFDPNWVPPTDPRRPHEASYPSPASHSLKSDKDSSFSMATSSTMTGMSAETSAHGYLSVPPGHHPGSLHYPYQYPYPMQRAMAANQSVPASQAQYFGEYAYGASYGSSQGSLNMPHAFQFTPPAQPQAFSYGYDPSHGYGYRNGSQLSSPARAQRPLVPTMSSTPKAMANFLPSSSPSKLEQEMRTASLGQSPSSVGRQQPGFKSRAQKNGESSPGLSRTHLGRAKGGGKEGLFSEPLVVESHGSVAGTEEGSEKVWEEEEKGKEVKGGGSESPEQNWDPGYSDEDLLGEGGHSKPRERASSSGEDLSSSLPGNSASEGPSSTVHPTQSPSRYPSSSHSPYGTPPSHPDALAIQMQLQQHWMSAHVYPSPLLSQQPYVSPAGSYGNGYSAGSGGGRHPRDQGQVYGYPAAGGYLQPAGHSGDYSGYHAWEAEERSRRLYAGEGFEEKSPRNRRGGVPVAGGSPLTNGQVRPGELGGSPSNGRLPAGGHSRQAERAQR